MFTPSRIQLKSYLSIFLHVYPNHKFTLEPTMHTQWLNGTSLLPRRPSFPHQPRK
jgi:hypothetical protein